MKAERNDYRQTCDDDDNEDDDDDDDDVDDHNLHARLRGPI